VKFRAATACLLLVSCALNLHAQEPQDVVRVSTNLVQVDAVVTKDGKPVRNLKAEDFEIREDGVVQQITNFSFVSVNSSSSTKTTPEIPSTATAAPPQPGDVKRTIAIVVDDLGMSFDSMANLRGYLRKFVSESLSANDLVAIIRTGGEVGALQQFTTDPRVLSTAIADLKWNPCSRVGASVLAPDRTLIVQMPPEADLRGRLPADRSPGSNQVQRQTTANESNPCSIGNSVNYSISAIRFVLRGMQDLPGRKSLLIVSDNLPLERQENAPADFGFKRPVTSYANLIDAWTQSTVYNDGLHGLAEQAIRSSVVVYGVSSQRLQTTAVQPADEFGFPPQTMIRGRGADATQPNNNPLLRLTNTRSAELQKNFDGAELLAKETGGFVIRNQNDFGVDRVLEDQNGYYLIGYRPAAETFKRQLHKINLRVKRGGFAVRTRAGFYGTTQNATVGPMSDTARMSRALSSPFGASELTVRLTALFVNDPQRGSMLRTFVTIDPKNLTLISAETGTPMARLHLMGVLYRDNGVPVDRPELNESWALDGDRYERAQREGLIYALDVPLKRPGTFQLRLAVRDLNSQRIGVAGQFVQAPNVAEGRLALSGIALYEDTPNTSPGANDDWQRSLVLRQFRQGASLVFGYTIYNAALDKKTQQPRLTTQTVVLRDSVKIYSSDRVAVATAEQKDLKRISSGARLQLGPALTPGEYVVQIVVEDQVAKTTTTQVTQFEVK
jgi:VWFA-related protein